MKKAIRILVTAILISIGTLLVSSISAQPMPGGDPSSGGPGGGNAPVGGYAPIGSGLVILLALGAGYGTKKVYDARKKSIIE